MARPPLVVTRPEPQAERFAAQVAARFPGRFDIRLAPLLEILPVEPDALPLDEVDGLVFTSRHGVARFAALTSRRDLPAWCVGEATAQAARAEGFAARAAAGDADALAGLIAAEVPPGARLLQVRGRHVAAELARLLHRSGQQLAEAVVYDQRALPLPDEVRGLLRGARRGVVTLFSPRTARLLAGQVPEGRLTPLCLSEAVARELGSWGPEPAFVARRPDAEAMLEALARWH